MKLKPVSQIKLDLGINAGGRVQKFFTDRCRQRMDKYVPKRDNNLRTIIDIGADYITYESPYAHAQYVGYTTGPVRNYTTPRNRTILGQKNGKCRNARFSKRSTGVCKWK